MDTASRDKNRKSTTFYWSVPQNTCGRMITSSFEMFLKFSDCDDLVEPLRDICFSSRNVKRLSMSLFNHAFSTRPGLAGERTAQEFFSVVPSFAKSAETNL